MISFGKNITAVDDPLKKIPIEMLARAIRTPKQESISLIRQLRIVHGIDKQQYSRLKRQLPYIVCGHFNPAFRRLENFSSVEYFIVDLDHLSDKQVDPDELRQRLAADERLVLMFVSPSGDGLKMMYRLGKPCHDSGLYSIFYKAFIQKLASQFGVEQVVDSRTSDVTRACFISHDPEAYFNPDAQRVDLDSYVDINNTLSLFSPAKKEDKEPASQSEPQPQCEPSSDTLANIKQILSLAKERKTKAVPVFVPEQINDIMDGLTTYVTATGLIITEIQSIQYGKKIKSRIAGKQAETNIFYGRKGFSVVISPRSGTDPEMNKIVAELIQSFFDTNT